MTEQEGRSGRTPSVEPVSNAVAWAVFFYLVAIGLTVAGFITMFWYDPSTGVGEIVGGDAYNFTIIATRGVRFIAAGVVSALVAVGILAHR